MNLNEAEALLLSTYTRPLTINAAGLERGEPLSVARQANIQALIDADLVEFDRFEAKQFIYKLTSAGIQRRSVLNSQPKRAAS